MILGIPWWGWLLIACTWPLWGPLAIIIGTIVGAAILTAVMAFVEFFKWVGRGFRPRPPKRYWER